MNREEWLTKVADSFCWPRIERAGGQKAQYRVSVGFPHGRGNANNAIGQCWPTALSANGVHEIFISPKLGDAKEVVHVLLHELIHASDGNKNGHKGPFKKLATAVGLEGKMTSTVAGDALQADIRAYLATIGAYPHGSLSPQDKAGAGPGSRLIKMECGCGFKVRITRQCIDMIDEFPCPSGCGGDVQEAK